jgi:hypothetical protein
MAAPFYTQEEADMLIAMPKRSALPRSRKPGEIDALTQPTKTFRATAHERVRRIPVAPEDTDSPVKFVVETRENLRTSEYWVLLHAQLPNRPSHPVCRFDLQNGVHINPDWSTPPAIKSGEPHAHYYSSRGEREFNKWDVVATPVDLGSKRKLNYETEKRNLRGKFWDAMNIRSVDSESAGQLFGRDADTGDDE